LHWTDNKCGHFASECRYKSVRTNDRNSAVHDTVANVVIGAYSFMGEVSYHTVQDKNVWYADNGATDHMTFDDSLFVTYTKFAEPKPVRVGNNAVILAYGCDRVNVEMYVDEKWTKSFLSDVLYVPDHGINLFSLIVAEMKGYRVCAENSQVRLVHIQDDVVVAVGVRNEKSLYKMSMNVVRPDRDCEAVAHLTSAVNPKTEKLQF